MHIANFSYSPTLVNCIGCIINSRRRNWVSAEFNYGPSLGLNPRRERGRGGAIRLVQISVYHENPFVIELSLNLRFCQGPSTLTFLFFGHYCLPVLLNMPKHRRKPLLASEKLFSKDRAFSYAMPFKTAASVASPMLAFSQSVTATADRFCHHSPTKKNGRKYWQAVFRGGLAVGCPPWFTTSFPK